MCRDLATDVANILQQGTGYLKKRAALAAVRILRKCPEMVENFVGIVPSLLDERNHGVVLSAVELFYEILKAEPSQAEEFKRSLPVLIRMLRNLLLSGYSPEHDIAGITDPFL